MIIVPSNVSISSIASGGTLIDSGNFLYHVFTSSGTLTVKRNAYMIVTLIGGGGGGGGGHLGSGMGPGGGGGGKLVTRYIQPTPGDYSITVGTGGSGGNGGGYSGSIGSASTAFGYTATYGGGGGTGYNTTGMGVGGGGGGSGGGGGGWTSSASGIGGTAGSSGTTGNYSGSPGGVGGGWDDAAGVVGTFVTAGAGGSQPQNLNYSGGGGGGGIYASLDGVAQVSGQTGTIVGSIYGYAGVGGAGFGAGGGGGPGSAGIGGNGSSGIVVVQYLKSGLQFVNNASLMHFDNSIIDAISAVTWTMSGTPNYSASVYKFGNSSMYFSGSQYLTTPNQFDFSNYRPFTAECWFNPDRVSGGNSWENIMGTRKAGDYCPWQISQDNTGFALLLDGAAWGLTGQGTGSFSANTWHHVAICGDGTTLRIFINGVMKYSVAQPVWTNHTARPLKIGQDEGQNAYLHGYLDEFRLTFSALYTGNFTPPTASFS